LFTKPIIGSCSSNFSDGREKKQVELLKIKAMKKMLVVFAMILAFQAIAAQTASGGYGRSRQETEMNQRFGKQTECKSITVNQTKGEQTIRNYSEMSIGSTRSNSGQWRGLVILIKLIVIGVAFASRGGSDSND